MHSNVIERGEGAITWELDDSREFFDEENEPQILDIL